MTTDAEAALGDGMSGSAEDKGEAVKRRRRRGPTWEIHSVAGVRIAGGDGSDWWDRLAPAAEAVRIAAHPADERAR